LARQATESGGTSASKAQTEALGYLSARPQNNHQQKEKQKENLSFQQAQCLSNNALKA
jgi:hypothetical protein